MPEESIQPNEKQLVVFDLSSEVYGVDIGAVREIIRLQEITRVPRTAGFVEGVIDLRGKVIPVIDLRKRFDLPGAEENGDNRIVVVNIITQDIGMVVDAVTEVLRIPGDAVEPLGAMVATAESECLLGIAKLDNRLIILLDLEQLLSQAEQNSLLEVAKAANSSQVSKSAEGIAASAETTDAMTKELQEVIGQSQLNGPRLQ